MLGRRGVVPAILAVGIAWCAPAGSPAPAAAADLPVAVYRQRLPDVTLASPLTGERVRLPELAAGRPAVILVTDGSADASCPLARALAAHQGEYAPWFTWTGITSGPGSAERIERLRRSSPVRFQSCLHDPEGAVARALGLVRLPALVLANERGYVHRVCDAAEAAADPRELAGVLHALAAASRPPRGTVPDFRLPRVGAEGLASFLDVAGPRHTILTFLHSGCVPCAGQLEVLEYLRDRHPDGVRLVAVFLDAARDERILGFLRAAGAHPDAVLRDPELRLARRHRIEAVPTVLVADAAGRIVHAVRGYRAEERSSLYRAIDAAFDRSGPAPAACPGAADPIRIHAEALAYLEEGKAEYALLHLARLRELLPGCHSVHLLVARAARAAGRDDLALESYARYLAAEPLAYDGGAVRARLAELLSRGR